MYSAADYAVTLRPLYPADGRKIPDTCAAPPELRGELTTRLGTFPLFNFWGPAADVASSRWIAGCARYVYDTYRPTLTLVDLPHVDYNLQRLGPPHPDIRQDLHSIDVICGELIAHVRRDGTRIIALSEYGITEVSGPIHINRALREAPLLRVKPKLAFEMLDAGASDAFAVADCCQDIVLSTGAHVRRHGKGRKERCTPLRKDAAAVLRSWLRRRAGTPTDLAFPTARGSPLSRDAVEDLLAKHLAVARTRCPSLRGKHESPHVLRHPTAMDLLQRGLDRSVIALWLGHESVETTQMYLDANLELKEKVLARTTPFNVRPGRYRPDDRLLAFLKSL